MARFNEVEVRFDAAADFFEKKGIRGFRERQRPLYRLHPSMPGWIGVDRDEEDRLVQEFYEYWRGPAGQAICAAAEIKAAEELEKHRLECAAEQAARVERARTVAKGRADAAGVEIWSLEKQRRSNIDWHALLPPEIAAKQITYERKQTMKAMVRAGMSYQKIGLRFGCTGQSIRCALLIAGKHPRPPAEIYFESPQNRPAKLKINLSVCKAGRDWIRV